MAKKARILVAVHLHGKEYQPNAVVVFDDKTAKSLQDAGHIDTKPEAVAYCVKALGAEVINHISPDAAGPDEVIEQ